MEQINFSNALIRHGFLALLDREFGIRLTDEELNKIELARQCIEIYDNKKDFYEATKWAKDNPEFSDMPYLEANRIARMVDGKVWYFSHIRWEELLKEGELRIE